MRYLLLIPFMFTSCVSLKKRAKICSTCPIESYDSVRVELKDTTIYVTEKGETKYLENPCAELCDSLGNLKSFHKEIKSEGTIVTIYSKNNKLAVRSDLDNKKTHVKYADKIRIVTKVMPPRLVERKKTWLQKTQAIWFWLSMASIAVYLGFKYFKTP